MRYSRPALLLTLILAACAPQTRAPAPPPAPAAPAAPGLEPVAGQWDAGSDTVLRATPDSSAGSIGRLRAGQPVKALGRVRGTDWIAVSHGGTTGYVRLHLLRLHETNAPSAKGASTVVPKPADNSGPGIKAAPRRKIEAAPIPAQ